MNKKALMVDVSRWQTKVDWDLLRDEGVCGAIVKCGQDLREDKLFRVHAGGARAAGMVVGAYHWFDPMFNPLDQAHSMRKFIEWAPGGVDFVAVDVEQFWADWREWELARQGKGKITKVIPGTMISERAKAMCAKLRGSMGGMPIVVYSRKTFIEYYAPQMLKWLGDYDIWLAWYPYSRTKVTCGWGELREKWLPKLEGPSSLSGLPGMWKIWQFTGDKFKLPGIGTADVNWFNGDEGKLRAWAGVGAGGAGPEPKPEPVGERLRARYRMNVRSEAGEMGVGAIVGKVEKGEVVEVLERVRLGGTHGSDVWVRINGGWMAEVYRNVRFLEVVRG